MKKVVAIMGSPRKGEGFKAVQTFEKKLKEIEDVDFEYVFLRDVHLEHCKGCLVCIAKGEELCPLKDDDRDKILVKMLESDGVVFATPNYSLQITALMKNLFDRLAYIFHRPCFFHKCSIAIVNQGIYGGEKIVKYINEVGGFWGFNTAKGVVIATPPGLRMPAIQAKIDKSLAEAAKNFHKELNRKNLPKPGVSDIVMFRMIRTFKPYGADIMPRDYEYFKEKGWMDSDFFYNTKLGLIKRAIGWIIDKQAVKMGEKMVREQEEFKNQRGQKI